MLMKIGYKDKSKILIHFALILTALFMVIPFIWMLLTSFKTLPEALAVPPKIMPKSFHFKNYKDAVSLLPFFKFYFNTIIVIVIRVVI